jgi:hypothetical protein
MSFLGPAPNPVLQCLQNNRLRLQNSGWACRAPACDEGDKP